MWSTKNKKPKSLPMFKSELYSHAPNAQFGQYKMSQNQLAPTVLAAIIEYERPDIVIEIGTQHGGLTCALRELTRVPFRLVTYDAFEMFSAETIEDFKLLNIEYQNRDCFDGHLHEFICKHTDKKFMILCDGGNKNKEFETFMSLMSANDIIMAHDCVRELSADRPQDWMMFWNSKEFTLDIYPEELKLWSNPWWFWLACKAGWYGIKKFV